MGRRQIFFWIAGSVLLVAGLLAVLVVPALPPDRSYPDPVMPEYAEWVEDSGLPTGSGRVFWLEDRRVLFRMLWPAEPSNPRAFSNMEASFAIWIPGTSVAAAEVYYEGSTTSEISTTGLCYADGHISYNQLERATSRGFWIMGRLGEERPVTDADREPGTRYNRMACRFEPWPERWAGQNWIDPLRPGHGWIEQRLAGAREPGEVIFYPTADHPGIDLDLHVSDVNVDYCFRWIAWRQAYFTGYCGGRMFLEHSKWHGVWLWPEDGRVEIPPDLPPPRSVSRIWPVPAGWLATIYQVDRNDDLHASGLYLWRDGAYRLLIPGIVWTMTVTGDGCRVAFGHVPVRGVLTLSQDWRLATLKVIDLCVHLDSILEEAPVVDPQAWRH